MAMNTFKLPAEAGGAFSSMVRLAPTYIDARVLAANAAEVITVPTGAKFVVFSCTTNFYARPGAAAAVPAADVTDGTGSELNPAAWHIDGVATIGVIAPGASILTTAFYK